MLYKLKHKAIDNLLLLMLVLSTGGLLFVFNRNISYGVFIVLLLIAFISGKQLNKSVFNASLLTLSTVIILFIINYIFAITEQTSNKYAYYLMVVIVSVLTLTHFLNNRNEHILVDRLYFVLKLVMIHALFNFAAYFFIKGGLTSIVSTYHESNTFKYLFFYSSKEFGLLSLYGIEFHRNSGLFWEPGILQAFLNMFFFLEAFIIKKNKLLLGITAIVLLTTYSTTGIALLLVQAGFYIAQEMRNNKMLIPIILLFAFPAYMVFSVNIEEKVHGEKEASFQKRLLDLTQPLFIALENPLTGVGLDMEQFQKIREEFYFSSPTLQEAQKSFELEQKVKTTSKGSSNSVMFLFAAMGFPTALLFLSMFFKQKVITHKNALWVFIMLISVMSEPLLLRPFFFFFISSGLLHLFYKITIHKRKLS